MNSLSNQTSLWILKRPREVTSQKNPKFLVHLRQHPDTELHITRLLGGLAEVLSVPKNPLLGLLGAGPLQGRGSDLPKELKATRKVTHHRA